MMTLSNGVQIAEYRMPNGATDAIVEPDGRAMTETEWEEYCAYVKGLSLEASRKRLLVRTVKVA
jgi:hypothetical protein